MNPFLLVGGAIIVGFFGARAADKVKVPWVVGYIIVGAILGVSGLDIITPKQVATLEFISIFALALIGFTIGGELEVRELKELGRSIVTITIFEATAAFALVTIALRLITGNVPLSLVFGALAAATAPAATVDVLWQYHSRGPLTTTLFAVVGLDDAAALIIYAFATSFARVLLGSQDYSLFNIAVIPLLRIGGSLLVGGLVGVSLHYVLKRIEDEGHVLILALGGLLLCVGIATAGEFSLILTAMAFGFTLINLSRSHRSVFKKVATINPPIFLLFFVLVGARVRLDLLAKLGLIGLAYLVMRVVGKTSGAYTGAVLSRAPETVRKYLGLGLLSQAGVAIGLAIDASHSFRAFGPEGAHIGALAISVIAATTFVYQILGPPLTKLAIFKAGEVPEEFANR